MYAGIGEEPPCRFCRVELISGNEEVAAVYMTARRQYVTGEHGRVVDLSIHAVKIVMDLYGIADQRTCLKRVLKTFYVMQGKSIANRMEPGEIYPGD